jgi:hypothetical protein
VVIVSLARAEWLSLAGKRRVDVTSARMFGFGWKMLETWGMLGNAGKLGSCWKSREPLDSLESLVNCHIVSSQ